MKLLVFTRSTPWHFSGGMEYASWYLCSAFADAGHDVTVVTTQLPLGRRCSFQPDEKISMIFLPSFRAGQYSLLWMINVLRHWLRVRHLDYDAIFSVSAAATPLSLLPISMRPPILYQVHGTAWGELLSKLRSGKASSWIKALRNLGWLVRDLLTWRHYEQFVTVGETVHQRMTSWPTRCFVGSQPETLVVNGIDPSHFHAGPRVQGKVLVLSRILREKGVFLALQIFQEALKAAPELSLTIAGEGRDLEELRSIVKTLGLTEKVEFLGDVSHDIVPDVMRRSSVLLFPTVREEGLPTNILEALSCGLPVVTTNLVKEDFGELARVEKYALDDVEAMVRACVTLAQHADVFPSMLHSRYTMEVSVSNYLTLLQSMRRTNDLHTRGLASKSA